MPKQKARSKRRPRTRSRSPRIRDLGKLAPRRKLHNGDAEPGKRGVSMPCKAVIERGRVMLVTRTGRSVDMRTRQGRHFLDILNDYLSDLGGADNVSTAELRIVLNQSVIDMELDFMRAGYLAGEDIDWDTFVAMSKHAITNLRTLGLRRRAKSVNGKQPSLADIRSGKAKASVIDLDYEEVE